MVFTFFVVYISLPMGGGYHATSQEREKIYTPQQASANNDPSDHTSIGIYQLPIISNYVKYVYVTRRAPVELVLSA